MHTAPRRVLLALLTIGAFALASVPTALAVGTFLVIPATVVLVGIVTVVWVRRFNSASTVRPSGRELLLVFGDALMIPCLLGLLWIGLYWAIHAVASASSDTIAIAASAPVAAFLAWPWAELVAETAGKQLFPDAVGAPSLFAPVIATWGRRLLVYVAVALAVLVGIGLATASHRVWFGVAVLFCTFWIGACIPNVMRETPSVGGEPLSERLARAFAKTGYALLRNPRTGDASADPFLLGADLFVYRRAAAFVVEVKELSSTGDADWTLATSVINAARALEGSDLPPDVTIVRPLLVLVGARPNAHLLAMCEKESLAVLALLPETRDFVLVGEVPGDDLSDVAKRVLDDPDVPSPPAPTFAVTSRGIER